MSIIPEVKCHRCGESYSSARSACPNCGTRRVTQSGRTPNPASSTAKGTASYERAATNTKWQMIFGLILVVAVILAVIVMVSTSLDGSQGTKATPTPDAPTSNMPAVESVPTPSPTPTPRVEKVTIMYQGQERTEFTMHLGDAPIPLTATPYPLDIQGAKIRWSSGNEDVIKVTPTEDGGCTVEVVDVGHGAVIAECFGVEVKCLVYVVD